MTNPYWYKLIKLKKANKSISTGLTIPYLFGAYNKLGHPFDSIKALMESIYESSIDKYPVIQRCNVIGQHVVMVEKKEICNKFYIKDVRFENATQGNVLFISTNSQLGNTFDKVCTNLTDMYNNPIKHGEYSWDNSEQRWKEFSDIELKEILSLK